MSAIFLTMCLAVFSTWDLCLGFFSALGLQLQGVINSNLTEAIPYAITIVMIMPDGTTLLVDVGDYDVGGNWKMRNPIAPRWDRAPLALPTAWDPLG